MKIVNK